MPTLQDLRDERANVWSAMTEIMTRTNSAPVGEDAAAYDKAEARLDALGDSIERGEKHDKMNAIMSGVDRSALPVRNSTGDQVDPDEDDDDEAGEKLDPKAAARYRKTFNKFLRNGNAGLDAEGQRLMQSQFRTGDAFKNAAGVGTGAAGGFMVPPEFRDIIVQTLLAFGPMLSLAETFETTSGVNIPWPTNNDTANEGSILGENTAMSQLDVTLGTNSLDAFMYTSNLVLASYQLLQDRPDFDTWLAGRLGERLARIYNRHATTGTGTGQPDGIVTSATVGVTGTGSLAATSGYSYDNLVDLLESVDDAYLQSTNPRWMMHQQVRARLRKLKDAQNRPLWEPSVQAGQPDMLMGYPTSINNHMAAVAQNSKSLLFGDIKSAYVIRIVRSNELVRLNERYADALQVGFFAFGRLDGTLQNPPAVKVFQTTATA
jgi:HK97 family phage major capsid protein